MFAQRLRRSPDIETALGDCPVFAWTAMRVMFFSSRGQKNHYPDNTIHWPNDLATSNVIFDIFIRTVQPKCQPLPTHDTTLSAI